MKQDRRNAAIGAARKPGAGSPTRQRVTVKLQSVRVAGLIVLVVLVVGFVGLSCDLVVRAIDSFSQPATKYFGLKSAFMVGVAMILFGHVTKLATDIALHGWKGSFGDLRGARNDE